MACVVAFLLKTSSLSLPVNQFIFVAHNQQESFYNIYEPKDGEFPIINGDIQKTKVEVKDLGTYVSVYCSKTLKSRDILETISSGMVDLNLSPHYRLFPPLDKIILCSNLLDDMFVELTNKFCAFIGSRKLSWAKIDSQICPPNMIVRMALKLNISVVGKYKSFAPPKNNNSILIEANKRFRLEQLVKDGIIFKGRYWPTDSVAVAWYQGHLHLFQQRKERGWFPLTLIGGEHQNAAMLYYYVLGNNHEIWNSGLHLSTEINNILKSEQWMKYEQHIVDLVVSGKTSVPLNIYEHEGKLPPIIEHGHIGAD